MRFALRWQKPNEIFSLFALNEHNHDAVYALFVSYASKRTLTAFRNVNWYSRSEQTRSMEKLLRYKFEWVLPGHGRIHHDTGEAMREHLRRCVEWMRSSW
jgi:glyoxylase-like metal-dependent hydrolase (beta-lactamase superfamily II)